MLQCIYYDHSLAKAPTMLHNISRNLWRCNSFFIIFHRFQQLFLDLLLTKTEVNGITLPHNSMDQPLCDTLVTLQENFMTLLLVTVTFSLPDGKCMKYRHWDGKNLLIQLSVMNRVGSTPYSIIPRMPWNKYGRQVVICRVSDKFYAASIELQGKIVNSKSLSMQFACVYESFTTIVTACIWIYYDGHIR